MAYSRQNFQDGDVLHASQLNHIEDGIVASALTDLSNVASNAVTSAKIASNAVSESYTATASTSNWVTTYGTPTNNVTASVSASDKVIVDLNTQNVSASDSLSLNEEWGKVYRIEVFDNALQLWATSAPTINIPIKYIRIRK